MTATHLNQIVNIIETNRMHEDAILIDSRTAANKIIDYLNYHFEITEKTFDFVPDFVSDSLI